MTILNLNFHQVFRILEIGGIITCTWPHDPDAGKLVYVLREIYWLFCVLNAFIVKLGLMYTLYLCHHDITMLLKTFSELGALVELLSNMIIYRLKRARMQHLLKELKDFRASNDHEGIILQKYIDRYIGFGIFILMSYSLTAIHFCSGPIFQSKKLLPIDIRYPFAIESSTMIPVLYIGLVFLISQIALGVSVDFMYVILLLYSAAKLEMLCFEIQNTKSKTQMHSCIKKHQEIIKFVNETKHTVQLGLFKTNIIMAITAICGAFPIIRKQPLWTSSQFILLMLGGSERLYVTAWPAEDLMQNSIQVAKEIYNMSWIGKSQSFTKDMLFIMQRSQKPLLISMGRLLPALSLSYYYKYLGVMFSYFTTMRAIFGD